MSLSFPMYKIYENGKSYFIRWIEHNPKEISLEFGIDKI